MSRVAGRRAWPLVSLCVGTVAAFAVIMAAGPAFVPDDVYFYLKIADSIWRGEGSTFNGLQPTNGYHPLWMVVCVAARAVTGVDPLTQIRVHFALCGALALVAIALAYRLSSELHGSTRGVAAAMVGAYTAYNAVGSEFHLSLPLLLLSAGLALRVGTGTRRSLEYVALGAVLGAAVLARLDNIFVAAALGLVAIVPRRSWSWSTLLSRGCLVAIPAAAVMAPYLAWNYRNFGELMPISGAIKNGLAAHGGFRLNKLGSQGWALTFGSAVAMVYWFLRGRRSRDFTLFALSAGAVAHSAYVLLRMEAVWTWYYATELIACAFTFEALASSAERAGRVPALAARAAAMACVLLLLPAVALRHARLAASPQMEQAVWYFQAVRWIDAHVSDGAAVALTSSPGAIGFFSHRPIVALDGLTGDFAWHWRAKREGLYSELHALGVRYVMGPDKNSIANAIARTRVLGHAGEGPAILGTVDAAGFGVIEAVGVYSGITRSHLGWLAAGDANLVGRDIAGLDRGMAMWTLAPYTGSLAPAATAEQ